MKEMSVNEIRELKKKYGISNARLSDESGVPLGTVNKILSGATECPRSSTLSALAKPLREREEQRLQQTTDSFFHTPADALVCEEAATYGIPCHRTPGSFSIEDYDALPDEHRVELIDGFFYDMAAPTTIHQRISLACIFMITTFIRENNGNCVPMFSPVDVQLSTSDQKTIVQPDILIVCDPTKIHETRVIGAPDFIIEIVSPSTSAKDYYKKASKYQESGVREYWIIDPIRKRLTVYYFETGEPVLVCPLEGKVGIGIYQNELKIDLDEIACLC